MSRVLALGLLIMASAVHGRTSFGLDFGWKFNLGNADQPDSALCPASTWTKNLSGYYCPSWAHQAAYQLTMDECRLYCCGDPCEWQPPLCNRRLMKLPTTSVRRVGFPR